MANEANRYNKVKIKRVSEGKNKGIVKRETKFYEKVPERDTDIWVMTQEGDRFDLLAYQYYGNQHLWWYLARANNMKFNNIPTGTTLRIPVSLQNANLD
tara:strand:- start:18 stop:314 length:297 start_codon:yes stop_codon:yes gene_type:complete